MSYLDNLRMVFAGEFQADTSTVNNDVRHYDNEKFEPRFQEFQNTNTKVLNGWWNPIGSGAFRLLNCRIQSVYYRGGSSTTDASQESAISLFIAGSNNRVGAKLVDLDPQWQLVSQIWGLEIRLIDGNNSTMFAGKFKPAAFRDILFGRQEGAVAGDQTASAMFQSVLTDVQWAENLPDSRFLRELKDATCNGLMSIRLTTFGYSMDSNSDRFTIGKVIGAIGPYYQDEPHSFVLGRRMVPLNGDRTYQNINFFDCRVDADAYTVFADLSNALPLTDGNGSLKDLGNLQLAVLNSEDTLENNRVKSDDDFTALGTTIPYRDQDWLRQTAGIWAATFPLNMRETVNNKPLALIEMTDSNNGIVLVRESEKGWLIRADNFVDRVEPEKFTLTQIFAARYGQPWSNAKVKIALVPPLPDQGGGSPNDPNPPKAPIPDINKPAKAVKYEETCETDNTGKAVLQIDAHNPNNPRGYLDGQIYMIQYQLEGQSPRQQQQFDYIYLLIYDEYNIPDQPTWIEHIQPIFQQYGNLYPIMSKQLVNLGEYDSVKKHRAILELAFSLDISDPNYMPVTRDLSRPKRETILKWLRQKKQDGTYALVYSSKEEAPPQPREALVAAEVSPMQPEKVRVAAKASSTAPSEELGGKTRFYESFKAAQRDSQNQ